MNTHSQRKERTNKKEQFKKNTKNNMVEKRKIFDWIPKLNKILEIVTKVPCQ